MERITSVAHLLDLLDTLHVERADGTSRDASAHWDTVLGRPGHPLHGSLPDANLVAWRDDGRLPIRESATALDVGCGIGRNGAWLARQGMRVTGVDIAREAIAEGRRRWSGQNVTFLDLDALREPIPGAPFDVVYDSGFFHHLAPHRRISYLAALDTALAPGGYFGLCTFLAGSEGSSSSDAELLRRGDLGEGIGYSLTEHRQMFAQLEFVTGGPLPRADELDEPAFSPGFLIASLFRRPMV